jgi:hypothetical protein
MHMKITNLHRWGGLLRSVRPIGRLAIVRGASHFALSDVAADNEQSEQDHAARRNSSRASGAGDGVRDPNEPQSMQDVLNSVSERSRSTKAWYSPDGQVEEEASLSTMLFDLTDRASFSNIGEAGHNLWSTSLSFVRAMPAGE